MPTLFKNGKNYSGTSVSLTQAEYDALSTTEKMNGTVYYITDSDAVLDASDVALGSGTVETLAGSIATIETSPATANHAVGTYIVYNGQLYAVTSAITAGQSLTVGTNISAATVADYLSSANTETITLADMTPTLKQLRKAGRTAILSIHSNVTSAINAYSNNKIVLPSEFRPSTSQNFFIAYKAGGNITISQWQTLTDGNVRCGDTIPTGAFQVTITYLL